MKRQGGRGRMGSDWECKVVLEGSRCKYSDIVVARLTFIEPPNSQTEAETETIGNNR